MTALLFLPLFIISMLLLYGARIVFKQYTYWKKRKMPHLKLIPVLGNSAPVFFRTASFAEHSMNLYKNYPEARYYGFFDFRKPAIIIKDPELIRDVCIKNFEAFMDHEPFVTEEMDPIAGRNLFSLQGQRWKSFRNTLSPSYTASRMKLMFHLIVECSQEYVQYFVDHPQEINNFEVRQMFTRYTNDVIATAVFGIKVNSLKDRNNEFYEHGQFTNKIKIPLFIMKLVLMLNFPRVARSLGLTFLPKSTNNFFKRMINETVKLRLEKGIVRPDMIQLLINAMQKKDGNVDVSMDDIVGQAFIFFTAGFETTSNFMSFIALELALNQDVQEKLHQEIDKLFENNEKITYESLTELKYLDMVMSETLRKYPLAAVTNRRCTKECTLPPPMEGYPELRLEKNTIVIIPIYGTQHNPKYYNDPEKFDPDRFNEKNKDKIEPYTYLPFGIGPRQCIGNRFAWMESKVMIVHILQKFIFKVTEKTEHPVEFSKKGFTLTPSNGIWLKLEERKKNN